MTPQPGTPEFKALLGEFETALKIDDPNRSDSSIIFAVPKLDLLALINGCRFSDLLLIAALKLKYEADSLAEEGYQVEGGDSPALDELMGVLDALNPPQSLEGGV